MTPMRIKIPTLHREAILNPDPSPSKPDEDIDSIRLVLELPPSMNHLYVRTRGGGIALTKKALAFREYVRKTAVEIMPQIMAFSTGLEDVYQLNITLYFDRLENPGWFIQKGGKRQAKSRYKVIDVDNRIKFLQDCVTRSIGIPNDSQVFESHLVKLEDPNNPRAEVTIEVRPWSDYFPKGGQHGHQAAKR